MKKVIVFMVCMCALFVFTACGSGESDGSGGSSGSSGGPLASVSAGDLNIEDFDWNVDKAKIEGYDCYALTLTNNSKFNILGVQIDYAPKADVTEEQLSVFDGFMEEHADYIDEGDSTKDIILRGDRLQYAAPGETISNVPLAIGIHDLTWTDIPDEDQYNLMEPTELTIGVVGSDDKLYMAYYNISDGKWIIDTETAELNEWPDMELAGIIPKPEGPVFKTEEYENINSLSIDVYGVSEDDFEAYVGKLKEAGFTDVTLEDDGYYSADDKDGNTITADYDKYSNSYDVQVYGK